jgi:hypothetical protein
MSSNDDDDLSAPMAGLSVSEEKVSEALKTPPRRGTKRGAPNAPLFKRIKKIKFSMPNAARSHAKLQQGFSAAAGLTRLGPGGSRRRRRRSKRRKSRRKRKTKRKRRKSRKRRKTKRRRRKKRR